MSVSKPSSTGTLTPAQQSDIGGTSFLDLPLELREMIYDLCAPKVKYSMSHRELPLQSKYVVVGINLLRCSKQIHDEVSQRLRLWTSIWLVKMISRTPSVEPIAGVNLSIATSGLHDLALAKIRYLCVQFDITTSTSVIYGIHGLESLLKLKSLHALSITLHVIPDYTSYGTNDLSGPENSPFITGFVIRVLSHIPTSVACVGWYFHPNGAFSSGNDTLSMIAKQYKSVRGSAYTS